MEQFIEMIGQLIFDADYSKEEINDVNNDILVIKDSYCIIPFPDVQEYMEEDWFNEEAMLEVEGKFGPSAYFIPIKYLIK